jgi:hypothetical protein
VWQIPAVRELISGPGFQSNAQVGQKTGVKMSKNSQKLAKNYKNSQKLAKMNRF